jgi:hypothetical protein
MLSRLEIIYNTMCQLNKETSILDHWTFEDLFNALPEYLKLKEDPRPQEGQMKDWQFSQLLQARRDLDTYTPKAEDIDMSQWATFPPQRQLIGSCGGESAANIMERLCNIRDNRSDKSGIALSGQFVYWHAEQIDEDDSEGTYLWATCEALRHHGACLNHLFVEKASYQEFLKAVPTEEAKVDGRKRRIRAYYQTNSVEEMSIALQMGFGVQIGVRCHSGWGGEHINDIQRGQHWLGGHAVELNAVLFSKGFVRIFNSWGLSGDGTGHSLMSMAYLKKYLLDARIIVR